MARILHKVLSDSVLGAVFKVHNYLGPGLLESAYEGAMVIELKKCGLDAQREVVYPLFHEGEKMSGAYVADLVVEGKMILELKSMKELNANMEAQLLNIFIAYDEAAVPRPSILSERPFLILQLP